MAGWGEPKGPTPREAASQALASAVEAWQANPTTGNAEAMTAALRTYRAC